MDAVPKSPAARGLPGAARYPRPVIEAQGAAGTECLVDRCCVCYEVIDRPLAPLDNGSPFVRQPAVPELQFVHVCLVVTDAPQKLVPLHDHAGITLLVLEIRRVGLRDEDVQVSPPDGRGAGDEFQVVGLEEHDVDGAHEFGRGAHDAVHPERLLERGRAQRGGRRRLNVKLGLHRQIVLPRHPEHLDVPSRLGDVPVDQFAVVRRPGRFRYREEVRGF